MENQQSHDFEFDNNNMATLPKDIMNSNAFSSQSIGTYEKERNEKKRFQEEDDDEFSMSDIDESMDRYRNRRGIPPKKIRTGESKRY